jgi:multiple sugar transport system substrate-binding protein
MWQPNTGKQQQVLQGLVNEWNKQNPNMQVTQQYYGNADYALQKVETAMAGGTYPNIAYLYGSWAANIATSPKTVDLNSYINSDPSFHWSDFWPAERYAATVNGKIIGIPALVDNLAVMYNKTLFAKAGLPLPTPNWTWTDFVNDAKALNDPANKVFGAGLPADGGEDTVWHYEAMLWEAGGDILNSNNTQAVFNSAAGIQAMQVIQQLVAAHAFFADTTDSKLWDLFNNNELGLYITGPWDLPTLGIHYGVVQMPSFPATPTNHQTISGPDNWVVFDHGSAQNEAAFKFLTWFTEGNQDLTTATSTATLPVRASELKLPAYKQQYLARWQGIQVWVNNEHNAVKARPVTPLYPKVSEALGNAIVSVELGRSDPKTALDQAAQQADSILSSGG